MGTVWAKRTATHESIRREQNSDDDSGTDRRVTKSAPPALTAAEEQVLCARWRDGDRAAADRLVRATLPFVLSVSLEYRRWGLPLEDIVQEGSIGLLKAAARFDPERGCRLVTYAAYWIRAEIRESVVRGYRVVRIGASKTERRALRIYRRTRERDPAVLAAQSGMTEARATALMPLLTARDVSLDEPTASGMTASDRLVSPQATPEDDAADAEQSDRVKIALRRVIAELPEREQKIVHCRWMTETPMTLEQLGNQFGISKERVRQLEERAKSRMRVRLSGIVEDGTKLAS